MFTTQIQTRRQSAMMAKRTGDVNPTDENIRAHHKTVLVGKGPVVKATAVPLATKKRSVLGDLSNTNVVVTNTAVTHGKPSVVMTKKVVLGTSQIRPRTRSSSAQGTADKERLAGTKVGPDVPRARVTAVRSGVPVVVDAAAKKSARKPLASRSTSGTSAHVSSTVHPAKRPVKAPVGPVVAQAAPRHVPVAMEAAPIVKKVRTQDWDDLDADDHEDPLMLSEYVVEIYQYLREQEIMTMPKPDYMDNQTEIQWKMRSILVDWLVEVHTKFRLLPETLYLSVNIIDRFLSFRVVSLGKLQLVGVTAMFIAAKYEEVVAPSIQNFLYMADGGYSIDEILKAERYILQVLDFNLCYPNPVTFLRRCSKADSYDLQTRTLAKYLMEVSLVDHRFISMPPSMVSAAGLMLARQMLGRGPWSPNLVHYSGYTAGELEACLSAILSYLRKPTKYEALYKKYTSRKFMKASLFVKDWMARQTFFDAGNADEDEDDEEEEEDEEDAEEGVNDDEDEVDVIAETEEDEREPPHAGNVPTASTTHHHHEDSEESCSDHNFSDSEEDY